MVQKVDHVGYLLLLMSALYFIVGALLLAAGYPWCAWYMILMFALCLVLSFKVPQLT